MEDLKELQSAEHVEKLEGELEGKAKAKEISLTRFRWDHPGLTKFSWDNAEDHKKSNLQTWSGQKEQITELKQQLSAVALERDLALETCEKLSEKIIKYEGDPIPGSVSDLVKLQEEIDKRDDTIGVLRCELKTSTAKLTQYEEDLLAKNKEINLQNNTIKSLKQEISDKNLYPNMKRLYGHSTKEEADLFHLENNLLAKEGTIKLQENCIVDLRKQLKCKDETIEEIKHQLSLEELALKWKKDDLEAEKKKGKEREVEIQRQNQESKEKSKSKIHARDLQIDFLIEQNEKNKAHWELIAADLQAELEITKSALNSISLIFESSLKKLIMENQALQQQKHQSQRESLYETQQSQKTETLVIRLHK